MNNLEKLNYELQRLIDVADMAKIIKEQKIEIKILKDSLVVKNHELNLIKSIKKCPYYDLFNSECGIGAVNELKSLEMNAVVLQLKINDMIKLIDELSQNTFKEIAC